MLDGSIALARQPTDHTDGHRFHRREKPRRRKGREGPRKTSRLKVGHSLRGGRLTSWWRFLDRKVSEGGPRPTLHTVPVTDALPGHEEHSPPGVRGLTMCPRSSPATRCLPHIVTPGTPRPSCREHFSKLARRPPARGQRGHRPSNPHHMTTLLVRRWVAGTPMRHGGPEGRGPWIGASLTGVVASPRPEGV